MGRLMIAYRVIAEELMDADDLDAGESVVEVVRFLSAVQWSGQVPREF